MQSSLCHQDWVELVLHLHSQCILRASLLVSDLGEGLQLEELGLGSFDGKGTVEVTFGDGRLSVSVLQELS